MPTAKKRINLSVDDNLYKDLEALKKLTHATSISAVVIELTLDALETQEDLYFSKISKEREKERNISHARIWKRK